MFRGLSPSRLLLIILIAASAGMGLALVGARSRPAAAREIAFSEVLSLVEAGRVRALNVFPETVTVELADGQHLMSVAPPGYIAANPTFITDLAAKHVVVRVVSTAAPYQYSGPLVGIFVVVLLGFVAYKLTAGRIPSSNPPSATKPSSSAPRDNSRGEGDWSAACRREYGVSRFILIKQRI